MHGGSLPGSRPDAADRLVCGPELAADGDRSSGTAETGCAAGIGTGSTSARPGPPLAFPAGRRRPALAPGGLIRDECHGDGFGGRAAGAVAVLGTAWPGRVSGRARRRASREIKPGVLCRAGGLCCLARGFRQRAELAACVGKQVRDYVELRFRRVRDRVLAADTGNTAAGAVRDIGQMPHHAQCFGAIQVPRPVAFLEGRLVELARRAQVSGGIADHAGSLGHGLQHRVRTGLPASGQVVIRSSGSGIALLLGWVCTGPGKSALAPFPQRTPGWPGQLRGLPGVRDAGCAGQAGGSAGACPGMLPGWPGSP